MKKIDKISSVNMDNPKYKNNNKRDNHKNQYKAFKEILEESMKKLESEEIQKK